MRCVKALIKTTAGLTSLAAHSHTCHAFAASGGSLLLSGREKLLKQCVEVLSALAVFSPQGHKVVWRDQGAPHCFHTSRAYHTRTLLAFTASSTHSITLLHTSRSARPTPSRR